MTVTPLTRDSLPPFLVRPSMLSTKYIKSTALLLLMIGYPSYVNTFVWNLPWGSHVQNEGDNCIYMYIHGVAKSKTNLPKMNTHFVLIIFEVAEVNVFFGGKQKIIIKKFRVIV